MQTSISGNAADVLKNVPSITVDIDGNASLRGSTNFTVLIDNRPSVMDAQDALQQIPASTIESIEIITNPSAKFDAEGNAGNSSFINSNGESERGIISFGVRGGIDFNLGDNAKLNFGGRYGNRNGQRNSDLNYAQWSTSNPAVLNYLSSETSDRSGWYYALNTNYSHKFPLKGHEISSELF